MVTPPANTTASNGPDLPPLRLTRRERRIAGGFVLVSVAAMVLTIVFLPLSETASAAVATAFALAVIAGLFVLIIAPQRRSAEEWRTRHLVTPALTSGSAPEPFTVDLREQVSIIRNGRRRIRPIVVVCFAMGLVFALLGLGGIPLAASAERTQDWGGFAGDVALAVSGLIVLGLAVRLVYAAFVRSDPLPTDLRVDGAGLHLTYEDGSEKRLHWNAPGFKLVIIDERTSVRRPGPGSTFPVRLWAGKGFVSLLPPAKVDALLGEADARGLRHESRSAAGSSDLPLGIRAHLPFGTTLTVIRQREG